MVLLVTSKLYNTEKDSASHANIFWTRPDAHTNADFPWCETLEVESVFSKWVVPCNLRSNFVFSSPVEGILPLLVMTDAVLRLSDSTFPLTPDTMTSTPSRAGSCTFSYQRETGKTFKTFSSLIALALHIWKPAVNLHANKDIVKKFVLLTSLPISEEL